MMFFSNKKNKKIYDNTLGVYKRNSEVDYIELKVSEDKYSYFIVRNDKHQILKELIFDDLKTEKIEITGYKYITITFFNEKEFEIGTQKVDLEDMVSENQETDKLKTLERHVSDMMARADGDEEFVQKHDKYLSTCTMIPEAREYVENKIIEIVKNYNVFETEEEVLDASRKLYAKLYGLSVIQELDDDIDVGEILVNATEYPYFECAIYYYKFGIKHKYEKSFPNLLEVEQVFNRLVRYSGKELNQIENAEVEATRPNKDRITISIPLASENWHLNIRKFTNFVPTSKKMHESGTVNKEIEDLLKILVDGKANIGIGGAMGTGKTTFINYLLSFTDPMERKTVIASVPEMSTDKVLKGHDVVILNVDEQRNFTFTKHMRNALRTTADRIIIPESRGEEFKQVHEANLKTQGNMFTGHAKDDVAFFNACVGMYLSSPEAGNEKAETVANSLAQSIQIVIIMRNVEGKIRIKSVSEVLVTEEGNYGGMNPLIEWKFDPENPTEGYYSKTKNRLSQRTKNHLNENGVPLSELEKL